MAAKDHGPLTDNQFSLLEWKAVRGLEVLDLIRIKLCPLHTAMLPAVFIMICLLAAGCAPLPFPTGGPGAERDLFRGKPTVNIADLEQRIHEVINQERAKHGLSQLAWNPALNLIARRHSQDMVKRGYFSHYSPEGHDVAYRFAEHKFVCEVDVGKMCYTGAENIYQNNLYDTIEYVSEIPTSYHWTDVDTIARTTVAGWMRSSGHRASILEPAWRTEGIGVAISNNYEVLITQDFC